jgi:GTPase SAR1 family protein
MYFRNSNIILLCYDITSRDSFANLDQWKALMNGESANAHIILIGTKKDLPKPRAVAPSEGEGKAEQLGDGFVETSAATREGIEILQGLIGDAALSAVSTDLQQSALGGTEQGQKGGCCA